MKQGSGSDNLAVKWLLPDGSTEEPIDNAHLNPLDWQSGDIDSVGKVTVRDATLSLRVAVGLALPSDIQGLRGDVNGDRNLNTQDAILILKAAITGGRLLNR